MRRPGGDGPPAEDAPAAYRDRSAAQRPEGLRIRGGSRTGRVAARFGPFRRLTGRAVAQLVAGEPAGWRLPQREVGTIAGTRSLGLGRIFPGLERPNDGVVTEREAHLPGAVACSVPVTHTGTLFSPRVARLVAGFLERGAFAG